MFWSLRAFWCAIFFCSLFSSCLKAQTNIISAQPIQNTGIAANPEPSIVVTFGSPRPAQNDVLSKGNWAVSSQGRGSNRPLHITDVFAPDFGIDGAVYLQVDVDYSFFCNDAIPAEQAQKTIQIVYQTTKEYVAFGPSTIKCRPGSASGGLSAATKKDNSDIYIGGSYTGVESGDPQWNLDTFGGYMKQFPKGGAIGAFGEAKTNSSKTADLDSFLAYAVYEHTLFDKQVQERVFAGKDGLWGPFQAPFFAYRVIGGEFDRKATQLNLIQSPTLVIPFRLAKGTIVRNIPAKLQWPAMTATFGLEVVNARMSVLSIEHDWLTRGLIGATLAGGYTPNNPRFNSIAVTSNWQLRMPSAPELFYDSKFAPRKADGTKGNAPPMLGTQPRHYLDTTFTYRLLDWIGVTFEHSYGSLPPVFNKTENTFKLGLSLTVKQSNAGRYSILRPSVLGSK